MADGTGDGMAKFSDLDRKRVIRFLEIAAQSHHDGEALNALRLAIKTLKDHGVSLADLARPSEAEKTRWFNEGREDGIREVYTRPIPWRDLARDLLAHGGDLSDWERKFCQSFARGDRSNPTGKQKAVFTGIAARYGIRVPLDVAS